MLELDAHNIEGYCRTFIGDIGNGVQCSWHGPIALKSRVYTAPTVETFLCPYP